MISLRKNFEMVWFSALGTRLSEARERQNAYVACAKPATVPAVGSSKRRLSTPGTCFASCEPSCQSILFKARAHDSEKSLSLFFKMAVRRVKATSLCSDVADSP